MDDRGWGGTAPCLTHRVPAGDLPPEIPPEPRRGHPMYQGRKWASALQTGLSFGHSTLCGGGTWLRAEGQPGGHLVGRGSASEGSSRRGGEGR